MHGLEAGEHEYIASLHVVGSLARGRAVVEPGKGSKGHVFFKYCIQVPDEEEFFSFAAFAGSHKMSCTLYFCGNIYPLGLKSNFLKFPFKNTAHFSHTFQVERTRIDVDDLLQERYRFLVIFVDALDQFFLILAQLLLSEGKEWRRYQKKGEKKAFHGMGIRGTCEGLKLVNRQGIARRNVVDRDAWDMSLQPIFYKF